jgi:internalin A
MNEEKPTGRYQAFISYSRRDKRALDELHVNLDHYAQSRTIEYWDDTKIPPGAKWREELQKALKSAAIAILLVSPEFLASGFIARNELPPLLKAAEEEGVTILCVILRDCLFQDSNLRVFQSVNPPSEPLNGMSQRKRDAVWVKVARIVKQCLEHKQDESMRI